MPPVWTPIILSKTVPQDYHLLAVGISILTYILKDLNSASFLANINRGYVQHETFCEVSIWEVKVGGSQK